MFTEDLDAFLDDDDFAIAATLQGGATGGVAVIFDRAYLEQMGLAGTRPVAIAKASAVSEADVVAAKTLTISGTAYTLKGREPIDDGSLVMLTLKA